MPLSGALGLCWTKTAVPHGRQEVPKRWSGEAVARFYDYAWTCMRSLADQLGNQ